MHQLLAGVYAKLDRAEEHLDTLDQAWTDVIESYSEKLLAAPKLDRDGLYTFTLGDFRPDMLPFAIGTGEFAYQTRSCLEHLVYALLKRSRKAGHTRTAFPIVHDRQRTAAQFIREHRNGALKNVPVRAIRLIETYQPYNAPDPAGHFLTIIKTFADADKHKTLFAAYTAPNDPSQLIGAIRFVPPAPRLRWRTHVRKGQRLKPGTKLLSVRPLPVDLHRDVEVDGKLTLLIQLRESARAASGPEGDFRDHLAATRALVTDFERHFF